MPIYDRTGRDLKKGQTVELNLQGMFSATVVDIRENSIAVPGRGVEPPMVVVQVIVPLYLERPIADLYVISEPQPKKPELVH